MAEPIQIQVEFTGTDEAVRGTTRVSDGLENMSDRSSAAARATEQLAARQTAAATAAIAFGQRLAAASAAVQGITSALGVEGQTAGLIGKITQTSTAMAQLGATFGPQGALVGGIIGAAVPAIQGLIQSFNEQEEAQQRLLASTAVLVESYDTILQRIRQVSSARAAESRISMGLGDAQEQQAAVTRAQQAAAAATETAAIARDALNRASFDEMQTAITGLRAAESAERRTRSELQQAQEAQRLAVADAQADVDEMMESLMSAGQEAAPARRGGGGGRRRAETPQAAAVDEGDAMAVVRDILGEQNAALAEQLELMEALNRQKAEAQDKDASIAAARAEQHEAEVERQAELKDALIESADKQREVADRQRQEYQAVTGVIAGGLNDALQAIIAGNKTAEEAFTGLLASFLKYISEQSMLKAIYEYAEAIASFASYRYDQGAQHLAAGVAYTAVAVAAGAGSAALSAPSSKGASEEKPASPESGRAGEGRGGGDVVIYYNSPVVTAGTRAELGRDMAGMIRAGTQRYGTV